MNKAQPKQRKQPKVAQKKQQRKIATKKVAKKVAQKPTLQQSTKAITTKAQPKLKSTFAHAMAAETASFAARPEIKTLTQSNRKIKIASLQLAWAQNWLCRRGLYYEDMFEEEEGVSLAIDMLPADVRKDRLRRMIRSCDLDLKMVWLPESMQQYDPFVSYGLDDALMKVDLIDAENCNYV